MMQEKDISLHLVVTSAYTSIGLQHKNLNNYVFRIVSLLIQSSRNGARLDCTYVWAVANEMVAHEVCLSKSYKDATTAIIEVLLSAGAYIKKK
jgi:hypothetical protein